jgi:hypothetical protein
MVNTSEILISEVIHELKTLFFNFFGFVSFIVIVRRTKNAQPSSSDKSNKNGGLQKTENG